MLRLALFGVVKGSKPVHPSPWRVEGCRYLASTVSRAGRGLAFAGAVRPCDVGRSGSGARLLSWKSCVVFPPAGDGRLMTFGTVAGVRHGSADQLCINGPRIAGHSF